MPVSTLDAKGKKLYDQVYQDELKGSCKGDEKCAAKKAWAAIKNAGWVKGEDGIWRKHSDLVEFSFHITKASYDPVSDEYRWSATASDTERDSYGERMSLSLYNSFIRRIQDNVQPPIEYCSMAWHGGNPYLSVAHYSDQNGDGIAGDTVSVFVDGKALKAKGLFRKTELGMACYEATRKSIQEKSSQPVRISIGFLDFKHRHGDFIFTRSASNPICPACRSGAGNKEYLDGQLIHLALTRIPVNQRTLIEAAEVNKSMTTKKEDAASIVGKTLAENLDNREREDVVTKSENDELIVKAEDIVDVKEPEQSTEACQTCEDKTAETTVEKSDTPEVVVEKMDGEVSMYRPLGGATTFEEAQTFLAAQEKAAQMYNNISIMEACMQNILTDESCTGDDREKKLKALATGWSATLEAKSEAILNMLSANQDLIEKSVAEAPKHPLDEAVMALKSAYDGAVAADGSVEDVLRSLQPAFEAFGGSLKSLVSETRSPKGGDPASAPTGDLVAQLSEAVRTQLDAALKPIQADIAILQAAQKSAVTTQTATPAPRQVPAAVVRKSTTQMSPLTRMVRQSVGLQE